VTLHTAWFELFDLDDVVPIPWSLPPLIVERSCVFNDSRVAD
jgi:hypothetical protein